eukprot:scaffold113894_cov19-Tisochrysis_lutea.AAC.6
MQQQCLGTEALSYKGQAMTGNWMAALEPFLFQYCGTGEFAFHPYGFLRTAWHSIHAHTETPSTCNIITAVQHQWFQGLQG